MHRAAKRHARWAARRRGVPVAREHGSSRIAPRDPAVTVLPSSAATPRRPSAATPRRPPAATPRRLSAATPRRPSAATPRRPSAVTVTPRAAAMAATPPCRAGHAAGMQRQRHDERAVAMQRRPKLRAVATRRPVAANRPRVQATPPASCSPCSPRRPVAANRPRVQATPLASCSPCLAALWVSWREPVPCPCTISPFLRRPTTSVDAAILAAGYAGSKPRGSIGA